MPFDSDVGLLGTGVAPLIAASQLIQEGKSVLLLNPEWDFFLEDSELSLDPLWPIHRSHLTPQRISKSSPEEVLNQLRPYYPGSIEVWPRPGTQEGYTDHQAPYLRNRSRLWVHSPRVFQNWETIEDLYVEGSDAGLKPQILEGLVALKKFPGFSFRGGDKEARAVLIPKVCDVDVDRYRNGLLEFTRERLGSDRIVTAVSQLDLVPGGIRFHAGGVPTTAKLSEGLMVFWTPRLSSWVLSQAKKREVQPQLPRGIRLWEEWSLISREMLDPSIVGTFEDASVWAEVEGPGHETDRLSVLRPGPMIEIESPLWQRKASWASAESFGALSTLLHEFLRWEKFSIRSLKARALFEWDLEGQAQESWLLRSERSPVRVVMGCDGPIAEVVRNVSKVCEKVIQ